MVDNPLYLPLGHRLNGRFTVGKVIGVGGFGVVYLAWDSNLDTRVAVKEFLPKEYAARSSDHVSLTPYTGNAKDEFSYGKEKFLEEAKALARFREHPGIVTVYESFQANNTAYMVMEHLDGMTLKEYLKRQPNERMSFETTVKALTPIMDALREVHNVGFVHRDVSPDNIFITRQKQIKLLDFGAARYALGEHSKSLTTVLKHGFAPVEQYSSKGNQGPWTDVYAVSATLYRCITGTVPIDAMERLQGDELKVPSQFGIEIPPYVDQVLIKGLALKALDRFADISQLQQALNSGEIQQGQTNIIDEVIPPFQPRQTKILICPECGAKNQLRHGEDQNALRCGKCKKELGNPSGSKKVAKEEERSHLTPDADLGARERSSLSHEERKSTALIFSIPLILIILGIGSSIFIFTSEQNEQISREKKDETYNFSQIEADRQSDRDRQQVEQAREIENARQAEWNRQIEHAREAEINKQAEKSRQAEFSGKQNQELAQNVIRDPQTNLLWMRYGGYCGYTFNGAVDLTNGFILAGYNDWRLPSVEELQGFIRTYGGANVLNDLGLNNVRSEIYWTYSSVYNTNNIWGVDMQNGAGVPSSKDRQFCVMILRDN